MLRQSIHPQPTGCGDPHRETFRRGKNARTSRDRAPCRAWRPEAPAALPDRRNGMQQLECAAAFAPLHTPAALSVIRFAQEHFPRLPQVACFDTTFHAGMPDVARVLPIPQESAIAGYPTLRISRPFLRIDRASTWDFVAGAPHHCPSRQWCQRHCRQGRKSIDTSMGLTPSGGVIMGTRSGDLDPGILVYLIRELTFDAAMLEDMIDHRSGLMGISGISSDMRRLHEASPKITTHDWRSICSAILCASRSPR